MPLLDEDEDGDPPRSRTLDRVISEDSELPTAPARIEVPDVFSPPPAAAAPATLDRRWPSHSKATGVDRMIDKEELQVIANAVQAQFLSRPP